MDLPVLTVAEARVLGCLIEKELTTPEYYPLTLNSLTAACNQKNNRDPVLELDERAVALAVAALREKRLLVQVDLSGSRVPKFRHVVAGRFELNRPALAVLQLLLLRGPQTVGELRGRSERAYPFAELAEVEAALKTMADLPAPLVRLLPRQPGQKEQRYAHLLAGEPVLPEATAGSPALAIPLLPPSPAETELAALRERVATLEGEMARLRPLVERLARELGV